MKKYYFIFWLATYSGKRLLCIENGDVRYVSGKLECVYRDYQGSVRAVVSNDTILKFLNYYPYGLPMAENISKLSNNHNEYLDKVFHTQDAMDMLECDWRMYIPALGTFGGYDKLSNLSFGVSAYSYCGGNPINFIDPTGLFKTARDAVEYAINHHFERYTVRLGRDCRFFISYLVSYNYSKGEYEMTFASEYGDNSDNYSGSDILDFICNATSSALGLPSGLISAFDALPNNSSFMKGRKIVGGGLSLIPLIHSTIDKINRIISDSEDSEYNPNIYVKGALDIVMAAVANSRHPAGTFISVAYFVACITTDDFTKLGVDYRTTEEQKLMRMNFDYATLYIDQ